MKNISHSFNDSYRPVMALLISRKQSPEEENAETGGRVYVESYDIGRGGRPVNAHPLSLQESIALAELLESAQEMQNNFLKSRGLLPPNLLYVNPDTNGYAIWYTPAQQRQLFFTENLGIVPGIASIPAMIWKGGREQLQVYALKGNRKPLRTTKLHHAPYFNIHASGLVCMGTVNIQIDRQTALEDFITRWEQYFFNSYFSHTLDGGSIAGQNIVQLWQSQVGSVTPFPDQHLTPNGLTLQELIQ